MTFPFIQDLSVAFARKETSIVCVIVGRCVCLDDNGMQWEMSLQSSQINLTKHDGYKSINSLQDSLNRTYEL